MLIELTLTRPPSTDLGFLLGKHPDRVQRFDLAFGQAHVFYPQASDDCCTAVLLLEVDPVGLVRGRSSAGEFALQQYVNDRPYVTSSFLSVALASVYRSALGGVCKERPRLVAESLPLEARVAAVPCRGSEESLRRLFEPLGYDVEVARPPLHAAQPDWGPAPSAILTLRAQTRLQDLLTHLYVLLPALDGDKHYWVGDDEVDKLVRRGEGWLETHPMKEWIAQRYLKRRRSLVDAALERLAPDVDEHAPEERPDNKEEALEARVSLNEQRVGAVLAALRAASVHRIVDLGCGQGRLLLALVGESTFGDIVGVDVSHRALEVASERLQRLPERQRKRIRLLQGSLVYRDRRIEGCDAATLVEVVEHLDSARLASMEGVVFGALHPRLVLVTTPNVEYNVRFEGLPAGALRHRDHRFEWTRAEFEAWAARVAQEHAYAVRFLPVGPQDEHLGAPTQMAIFEVRS